MHLVSLRRPFVAATFAIACALSSVAAHGQTEFPTAHRILFLGDSVTYAGGYVEAFAAYARLHFPERSYEIINLGVPSETVSGLSEPSHAGGKFPRPDLHERLDRALEKIKPDLVFACYGMNDGIYLPFEEERFQKYRDGVHWLHDKVVASGAKIIHLTPPVYDPLSSKAKASSTESLARQGYNDVLDRYSEWLLAQRAQGWEVGDLHGPMNQALAERRKTEPSFSFAPKDGVHPNAAGHWFMARTLLRYFGAPTEFETLENPEAMLSINTHGKELMELVREQQVILKDAWLTHVGHKRPGMKPGLPLPEAEQKAAELETKIRAIAAPFPGKRSTWKGYDRYDFEVAGKPVVAVVPYHAAPGKPWLWEGEFFGNRPAPSIALLGRGFHVVYMRVPNLLGCPDAVAHWNDFYRELTEKYGFAKKAALMGLSRGGLYCYNWAIANPNKVACLYGDAPVCDFKSWPGGKGKGKGSPRDWQLVQQVYHFNSEADALAYKGNPVDNLEPLAKARVPLLHVYGDADKIVPWDENTGVVAERYKQLGGSITLIGKPGVDHHPHGLEDSAPIVDFLYKHGIAGAAR